MILLKPVFEKGKADSLSELPSVIKQCNYIVHNSTKMKPIEASKKTNEDEFYSSLQDRKVRQKPKLKLGQLVRTTDIKKVFSKSDSTNWSYILYTITNNS